MCPLFGSSLVAASPTRAHDPVLPEDPTMSDE